MAAQVALLPDDEPGTGEPPPPDEPDLARGRIYHSDVPTVAPIDLAPGKLLGVQEVAMVVKVKTGNGQHRKFIGATSQLPGKDALCIGLNKTDVLDVWRAGGARSTRSTPRRLSPSTRQACSSGRPTARPARSWSSMARTSGGQMTGRL